MVRKATKKDLQEILDVYASARQYMKDTNNPNQWGDEFPPVELVEEDIKNESLYVIERDGELCGVMEFHIGKEQYFEELGDIWLYNGDYATVHRIASNGKGKGIFSEFLEFGKTICKNIRIDTHLENTVMQKLIEDNGFKKRTIFFSTPERGWVAYEKLFD